MNIMPSDPMYEILNFANEVLGILKNPGHLGMPSEIVEMIRNSPENKMDIYFVEKGIDQIIGGEPPSDEFTKFIQGLF